MIILAGNYSTGECALAHQLALALGTEARQATSDRQLASLCGHRDIRGVILDPSAVFVDEAYRMLGTTADNIFTPVVETPSELTANTVMEGLNRGAADVICRSDVPSFADRARKLCSLTGLRRPPVVRGDVLIAHEDSSIRLRLVRAFRTAGYNVEETSDASSPRLKRGGRLLVVSQDLWFDAGMAHSNWSGTVILHPGCSSDGIPFLADELATIGEASNPYDVVFSAGELLRRPHQGPSVNRTVVNSRMCTVRRPGGRTQTASIYSMSAQGVFVVTLAAHAQNSMVWIEFELPKGELVHLRGRVTCFASLEDTLRQTPPGFELTFDTLHCPKPDMQLYQATCAQLIAEMDGHVAGDQPIAKRQRAVTEVRKTVIPRQTAGTPSRGPHLQAAKLRKNTTKYFLRPDAVEKTNEVSATTACSDASGNCYTV